LRHVLHNNARISHVWELGRMLETRRNDNALWGSWSRQNQRLRELETVAMRFAVDWLGSPWPQPLQQEWEAMNPPVRHWFERFALSPALNLETPNKDVVWLHRELVQGGLAKTALVLERFVPVRLPEKGRFRERITYHARALLRALQT